MCLWHPFVCDLKNRRKKCFCSTILPFEVCSDCSEKRVNLNYKAKKFCMSYLPKYVEEDGFGLKYF